MWLDDIKDYIDAITPAVGLPVYELNRPESPEDCITIYEYTGLPVNQQAGTETPSLQLWLRTSSATLAENYAAFNRVIDTLMQVGYEDGLLPQGVTINGNDYLRITPVTSGIMPLGKNENGSLEFSFNFNVIRRK